MELSASVLIVSEADDLHARAVQQEIAGRGVACALVGVDDRAGAESFNIYLDRQGDRTVLVRANEDELVSPSDFGAIWWRRYRAPQKTANSTLDADQVSLLNNDCFATLRGAMEVSALGRWISTPAATERASNKILQLQAAAAAGFRIPETLVTQSPSALREFCDQHGSVIYKPVAGTPGPLIFTRFMTDELLGHEELIMSCPTMYQEYVPGEFHVRLNCFGPRSFASLIETSDLDWRPNLDVPIRPYPVPDELNDIVQRTLRALGLEMGIFDIKLTPEGEHVFLEVNPQGQFLFLEAATGEPLTQHMATYLIDAAKSGCC